MTPTSPTVPRRPGGVATLAAVLCLWSGATQAQRTTSSPAVSLPPADAWTVTHVLNRLTYGPRPGDIERVKSQGLAGYIDAQLHPERINDSALDARLAEFKTISMDSNELAEQYFQPAQQLRRQVQLAGDAKKPAANAAGAAGDPNMAMTDAGRPQLTPEQRQLQMVQQSQQNVVNELMQAKIIRAATSERQLEEVLTDFWFNHFNVYIQKGQVRNYLTEYEREAIRPHVLGKFRDLLGATAHSPAMLFYLDNWQSAAANANMAALPPEMARRISDPRLPPAQRAQLMQRLDQAKRQQPRGLNENYARELMELHTLGVDGGYTQQDVQEVARALTGWTIDKPQQGGGFVFRPQMHDTAAKTILGQKFDGKGGQAEGERVLDILAVHPSTAHHIAFELAQRFISDDPPATLVDRAAQVFLDTKGDLREVTRTIVTSPEFFTDTTYRAKVKTPLEFVVSALRATGTNVVNAQPVIGALRQQLGMPLYGCQPPTGYSMTSDAWVNTGALLSRMNFAVSLVSDAGRGMAAPGPARQGGPPPPQRPNAPPPGRGGARGMGPVPPGRGPLQVDLSALASDASESSRDRVVDTLLAGRVSDGTMKTLARAETPQQLVALTLGSPEFQRR